MFLRKSAGRPAGADRFARLLGSKATIRAQILFAFLVMSAITAALGGYATLGIRHAGDLVAKTFDESLMSINYARSAAADFAAMRTAFARRAASNDPEMRDRLNREIEQLGSTLREDLAIASERSQSERARLAAAKVLGAVNSWHAMRMEKTPEGTETQDGELNQYGEIVDQQVELLVNYTAGDAFLFRQRALAAIDKDTQFNIVGLALALILSGLVSWLLTRRIIGPVAVASSAAKRIAGGDLDTNIPGGGDDELGALLTSMGAMRDSIKTMMDREIAQRRSAQTRLADALESSREGVVVLDAGGHIALANSQAAEYMQSAPNLVPLPVSEDREPTVANADEGDLASDNATRQSDAQLPDGRWLRVSRSTTQEGGAVVVFSDITQLKQQKAELRATNLRLDAALDNMSQGLCLYGSDNRLQVVNRRFCEIFELLENEVRPGMTFADVLQLAVEGGSLDRRMADDLLADYDRHFAANGSGILFLELNRERVVSVARRMTSDGGWLATYEDVTEQRRAESQIAFMARHDALTKLPNRALFGERIEQAVAQAGRGAGFAVFCLDLDNFKNVNDALGHSIGDELLCKVAERLQACVREVDTVARLGGDEFAIIQAGLSNPEDASLLARRIVECVGAPYELHGQRILIGCSAGISMAPGDGVTSEKLLKNADVAMYRAKAEGRSTWRFFEPEMDAQMQARRALELDLREAMARDEFELFYQPLCDVQSSRVTAFEALLRWRHPTRGLVPPDQFIPLAEEIGLIIPLGAWVLKKACEQAALWPDNITIAVNVSAVQFRSPRLIDDVASAIAEAKLDAGRLELEITESVLLTSSSDTLATLHKLKSIGARIALDDFGTGYSSLSYLRSFPFDKLKIDKSFIRDVAEKDGSTLIVRAIIGLGRSLGMKTTAEGVETEEQLALLRAEGCDQAQGYLFSKPVPATEIAAILLTRNSAVPAKKSRMQLAG